MSQTAPSATSLSPDPNVLGRAVSQALSTTFEDMVFMEVSGLSEYTDLGSDQVYASLETKSPARTHLMLQMSTPLIDACIDALYAGVEATEVVREDVVRELLNTIAGLVMSNLTDDQSIQLTLPASGHGVPPTPNLSPELSQVRTWDLGGLVFTARWS